MLNIAELLIGHEDKTLFCPVFGDVKLRNVKRMEDGKYQIIVESVDKPSEKFIFNKYGRLHETFPNSECIIFPSINNRDWLTFDYLKYGESVMVSDCGKLWSFGFYKNNKMASVGGEEPKKYNQIIPVRNFDFTKGQPIKLNE